MTAIRIGFIGDLHVGRAERWTDEVSALRMHREVLAQQFAMCREHKCTHAIILGDVSDKPSPSQEQLVMVITELAANGDIPTIVMAGNHDVENAATNSLVLLRRLPSAGALTHATFHLKPGVVTWDGWRILVVPWGNQVPEKDADLVVFHDSVVGARMDSGMPASKGLKGIASLTVPAVGGHLHTPQRRGDLVFAGTAAQMSFGEKEGKMFWHLTLRQGHDPKLVGVEILEPIWKLKRVTYDAQEPPDCTDERTFYSLDVSGARPGPRWLVDHPRVVTMHGSRSDRMLKVASKVVNLMEGTSTDVSDSELLSRWLKQHSTLDGLSRVRAMKIHDRLGASS